MYNYGVGVLCITYNQVKYIGQCLDSLVSQNTNFPYKVIVHDDASNDGTAEIISHFARKYPNRVIPIYQSENIYSQGISYVDYTDPLLSDCKYVAICEGDDWWISKHKLQSQFDYMEKHPLCTLCVHNVRLFNEKTAEYIGKTPGCSVDTDFGVSETIEKGGGFFGTNSMFYRYRDGRMPDQFCNWGVGDYPTAIWLASLGYVHCLHEAMSVYRMNALGSWTNRNNASYHKVEEVALRVIRGLEQIDEYFGFQYTESLEIAINRQRDNITWAKLNHSLCRADEQCEQITKAEWRSFLKRQSARDSVSAIVKKHCPWLALALSRCLRTGI